MARAMWRGAIQFGLVTIPVKLYLATEARGGLSFHLLHKECLNRVQMKTHCPVHGEIQRSDTVRGFEWSKGQYVIIEEADFDKVPLKTVRAIEIEQFVDADREDYASTFVKQCYYLEPEPVGRKAFYLLKSVLADSGLQAICKIVLKDREALAALDPFKKTMLLSTLYWPDEVRDLGELDLPDQEFEFKPAEKQMATQLVQAMTGEFDPAQYQDEYRQALLAVIEAKIEGQPVEAVVPEPEPAKLTDLMAVLEASVAAARQGRTAAAGRNGEAAAAPEAVPAKGASGSRSSAAEPTHVSEAPSARTGSKSRSRAAATTESPPEEAPAAAAKTERRRKSA